MRLRLLYTLGFLLCLSTFASSNERSRFNCPAAIRQVKACEAAGTGSEASTDSRPAGTESPDSEARVREESVAPVATSLPILRLLSI